jgi:hypothetical protein
MDLAKKSIRVIPLLFAMVCIMLVGCSREDFSIQRVDAFPIIMATYASDGSVTTTSEGISLAVLPVARGSSDYFISVVSPLQDLRWESQAFAFDVDGIEYLGVSDLVLPPGFSIPEGMWALQILHSDGRVIEHSFQIKRNAQHRAIVGQSELWIPKVFWDDSSDGQMIPTMGVSSLSTVERSLQEVWDVQFIDANGTVITTSRAQQGVILLPEATLEKVKQDAVRAVYSRYDDACGCLLIGISFLQTI